MANTFTAHNVRLDDGTETFPKAGRLLREETTFRAIERTLRLIYPSGLAGLRAVDLGCLEGGYSVELARLGMEVTGVEVRPANFANCIYVKERVDLPNLSFVNDTAWNFPRYGSFDVVFCYGLLYHFDRPFEFLRLIGGNCRRALLLNTHFAGDPPSPKYRLSALAENEGLPGRWYAEHDGTPATRDGSKWASWENAKSFWLTKLALVQAIEAAGFDTVFEQFDFQPADVREQYYAEEDRGMFVALKPASQLHERAEETNDKQR